MSVDFFAKLPRNDASRRDEAVIEYIHTAYRQMNASDVPALEILLDRWRQLASKCVTGGLFRINWPEPETQISVSPNSVSYPLVANICDSEEEADNFIAVSIAMQVWLPSKPNGASYPWIHRYLRDTLAYQLVVEEIENDRMNTWGYNLLGNLRNRPEVITHLKAALHDSTIYDRRYVVKAAVKRMGRKIVPLLLQLITEGDMNSVSDKNARNAAILAVGKFPSHEATTVLLAQLATETFEWSRLILVEALGKMKDESAIEPLSAVLQNPDEPVGVRGNAAVALAKIDPNAHEKLQPYMNEPALANYYRFQQALEILDEPAPVNLLSINKASKLFNISRATINKWQQQGLIKPVYTPGGQRRFKEPEIIALIEGKEDSSSN